MGNKKLQPPGWESKVGTPPGWKRKSAPNFYTGQDPEKPKTAEHPEEEEIVPEAHEVENTEKEEAVVRPSEPENQFFEENSNGAERRPHQGDGLKWLVVSLLIVIAAAIVFLGAMMWSHIYGGSGNEGNASETKSTEEYSEEEPSDSSILPSSSASEEFTPYQIEIKNPGMPIYGGPGYEYPVVGSISQAGMYTIVQENRQETGEDTVVWGELESDVGWINLNDVEASNAVDMSSYYILPESSERLLTFDDIQGLSAKQLMLARNEIYARHGRIFQDDEVRTYFESQPWYHGIISPEDFSEALLSEIEKENIKLIQDYESQIENTTEGSSDAGGTDPEETASVDYTLYESVLQGYEDYPIQIVYFLLDMDSNGVYELGVEVYSSEAQYAADIYTIKGNSAERISQMELSHSTLYVGEKGEIYRQRGHMGYFSLSQISLQGDQIVEEMIYESSTEEENNPEGDYAEYQKIETYLETHGATIVNRYLLGEDPYPWEVD